MHTNRIQNLTLNVKLAYTRDHCITSKQSGVQCKECDSKDVMQMTDMPIGMMLGMGLICLLLITFLILGIVACIKYLRS